MFHRKRLRRKISKDACKLINFRSTEIDHVSFSASLHRSTATTQANLNAGENESSAIAPTRPIYPQKTFSGANNLRHNNSARFPGTITRATPKGIVSLEKKRRHLQPNMVMLH